MRRGPDRRQSSWGRIAQGDERFSKSGEQLNSTGRAIGSDFKFIPIDLMNPWGQALRETFCLHARQRRRRGECQGIEVRDLKTRNRNGCHIGVNRHTPPLISSDQAETARSESGLGSRLKRQPHPYPRISSNFKRVADRARTGDRLDHNLAAPGRGLVESRTASGLRPPSPGAAEPRHAGIYSAMSGCTGRNADFCLIGSTPGLSELADGDRLASARHWLGGKMLPR